MSKAIRQRAADHEVFWTAIQGYCDSHGIGVGGQAAMIGREVYGAERSADWLYKMCEGHRAIPVGVWRCVQRYTKSSAMVQHLSHAAGGVFVPVRPIEEGQEHEVHAAVTAMAAAIQTMMEAQSDGVITPEELVQMTATGWKAIEQIAGLLHHAERVVRLQRGNIRPLAARERM